MISFADPLPAGNAVRLHLAPPIGALEWRVLRRPTDDFTGHEDPGALRVGLDYGPRPGGILDTDKLLNGSPVVYRFYWRDAIGWKTNGTRTVTPAATYQGEGPDAAAVLRERIALGLAEEIRRGALKPASGRIHVVTAPFGAPDDKSLPAVSVHLDTDQPANRFLGEVVEAQLPGGIGDDHRGSEGQLSRVALNVTAVSLNGDERSALRRALKRIVLANMPVFDEAGLLLCEFAQRDTEEVHGANGAVLYFAQGSFSCVAPAVVSWPVTVIADVVVTASFPNDTPEDPTSNG